MAWLRNSAKSRRNRATLWRRGGSLPGVHRLGRNSERGSFWCWRSSWLGPGWLRRWASSSSVVSGSDVSKTPVRIPNHSLAFINRSAPPSSAERRQRWVPTFGFPGETDQTVLLPEKNFSETTEVQVFGLKLSPDLIWTNETRTDFCQKHHVPQN